MILGLESSAISAGAALTDGGKLVAEEFLNTRHTHSETLLPMVKAVLERAGAALSDVDKIAVSAGPGSFTGLRIGISCVKGLAMGAGKPVCAVSALEAAAYNMRFSEGVVCCCMDARRKQVYNALFRAENGILTRLCEDRALSLEELSKELSEFDEKIIFVGDGAELAYEFTDKKFILAPAELRFQRGFGVCLAAENAPATDAAALMPVYLRLSQAERERSEQLK